MKKEKGWPELWLDADSALLDAGGWANLVGVLVLSMILRILYGNTFMQNVLILASLGIFVIFGTLLFAKFNLLILIYLYVVVGAVLMLFLTLIMIMPVSVPPLRWRSL